MLCYDRFVINVAASQSKNMCEYLPQELYFYLCIFVFIWLTWSRKLIVEGHLSKWSVWYIIVFDICVSEETLKATNSDLFMYHKEM